MSKSGLPPNLVQLGQVDFPQLSKAIQAACENYSSHKEVRFMIMQQPGQLIYRVYPWGEFRHLPGGDPLHTYIIVFQGTIHELTLIAWNTPQDLFKGVDDTAKPKEAEGSGTPDDGQTPS